MKASTLIAFIIIIFLAFPVYAKQQPTAPKHTTSQTSTQPEKSQQQENSTAKANIQLEDSQDKTIKKSRQDEEKGFFSEAIDFLSTPKNSINIFAIIFGPVIAVFITKWSDDRRRKRDDKMQIFKTLITDYTYLIITGAWSTRCVEMLNQINLTFRDDKDVECNWRKYYSLLSDTSDREGLQTERDQALVNMLNSMAKSLGYKDFSLLEKDNILYAPNAMKIEIQKENQFKNLQLQTLSGFAKTFSENQSQKNNTKYEETAHPDSLLTLHHPCSCKGASPVHDRPAS